MQMNKSADLATTYHLYIYISLYMYIIKSETKSSTTRGAACLNKQL